VGLGLLAWAVALWRCGVLTLRAPVAAPLLAAALARRDRSAALALCEALPGAWAAASARAALTEASPAELPGRIEEELRAYRARAELGLGALHALGRMAFPLALGSAIIALSTPLAEASRVQEVERALAAAVQCVTTGLLTHVFCRSSADWLRKLGARRLREIKIVSEALRAVVK
jgi:hypothetical protein